MKRPAELSREELEHIVGEIQHAAYYDYDADRWDRDRPIGEPEMVEAVCNLMEAHDLVPDAIGAAGPPEDLEDWGEVKLRRFVVALREVLFYDVKEERWDPDLEWNSTTLDDIGDLVDRFGGLRPPPLDGGGDAAD